MAIILLTLFISVLMALFFLLLFLAGRGARHLSSPESDALIPFADDGHAGSQSSQHHTDPTH